MLFWIVSHVRIIFPLNLWCSRRVTLHSRNIASYDDFRQVEAHTTNVKAQATAAFNRFHGTPFLVSACKTITFRSSDKPHKHRSNESEGVVWHQHFDNDLERPWTIFFSVWHTTKQGYLCVAKTILGLVCSHRGLLSHLAGDPSRRFIYWYSNNMFNFFEALLTE